MFRDSRIFCVSLFTLSSKSQIQKIWRCPMGRTCPSVTPFASNELYTVLPSLATRPLCTFFCVVPLRSRQSRNSRTTFIKSPCGRIVIGTIYHLPKKAKKILFSRPRANSCDRSLKVDGGIVHRCRIFQGRFPAFNYRDLICSFRSSIAFPSYQLLETKVGCIVDLISFKHAIKVKNIFWSY